MLLHMQEISKAVPKGRHAVVVMDGALWHQPSLNQANVTMLKLPPYSPELNLIPAVNPVHLNLGDFNQTTGGSFLGYSF